MATTERKRATEKAPAKKTAAAPRQRPTPLPIDKRALFQQRAQEWLLARDPRTVSWPDDLAEVTKLGVPCDGCGVTVHRIREDGHTVFYQRTPGHWSAGVTVQCRRG